MPKFGDIEEAYLFANGTEGEAWLCRETGDIHCCSPFGDDDPLPDDIDSDRYVAIPGQRDLGLGRRLVTDFVRDTLPDAIDDVDDMFRRKGAWQRYKRFLDDCGKLDAWHAFENERTRQALREWCADEGIVLDD